MFFWLFSYDIQSLAGQIINKLTSDYSLPEDAAFVVLVVVEVVVSEVVEAVAVVEVVVDCASEAELLLLFLLTPCETTKLVPRPKITKISCT